MPGQLRAFWVVMVIGVLAASSHARAGDLGKFLEQATGDRLRQAVAPKNLQRALTPPSASASPTATASGTAQAGEPFVVKTADGWSLVAHRYKPTGPARTGALPVILCHGLTYNAQFWDLDPSCSFAQYLSQLGFDVWAVNLRGSGLSHKWVWNLDNAPATLINSAMRRLNPGSLGATGFATLEPKYANWTMDHHIAYDVPALVKMVRRHTGAAEVAWVGHSMGGIVALGCLARYQNPGIGRLVTVGSQVTMPEGQVAIQFLTEMLTKRQLQLAGQWNSKEVMTQTRTSVNNLFFNARNVDPKIYEALTGWATDVPAIGLMQQYMLLANKGELLDSKGQFNYARAVGNVKVPIFISCGEQDSFAPPIVQRYLYDHVGSTDKTLFIFGKSQGLPINAGHDDSLVGLNSREQTYPVIARWLAGQQPPTR
ncbi:alpha/beta fold hydrolase [Singulisphaera acidiphila]|uniref:Lysophospholipase n=1 Tax=Singulisphaera acidiphila (strain ATCC BAA-1392 / DSM 18658 / VKM B-2454 / MOB10) TaxID=886293 RepID=L0DJP6_SINAD|nr:alpha/beta fold hydrolase [Singulisphaera acidiphila]AGA29070.1 lysophospholipase [Singulisphaera acidiphila DSM 18658]